METLIAVQTEKYGKSPDIIIMSCNFEQDGKWTFKLLDIKRLNNTVTLIY